MLNKIEISIAKEIFDIAPGYRRNILVANNIKNGSSPAELVELLRLEEARVRELISLEDPRLVAWREAFRKAGIKTNKFRPSVDALIRRVLNGGTLPSISTLVDIGTVLSLRHLAPCGAHSLNDVNHNLALRFATGVEQFTPFGANETENINPGEIIYTDGNIVATSKWAWRQASHTIIDFNTTAFELNIDAFDVISDEVLHSITSDTQDMIKRFLSVEAVSYTINEANPAVEVTLNS